MSERLQIEIVLNGKRKKVASQTTLLRLIEELGLNPRQVAAELNRAIVQRDRWPDVELKDDDSVEIVHFVGGGSF